MPAHVPVMMKRPERSTGGVSPYRRTFIGRETELAQLKAAFDSAAGGTGGVVTLAGEPGIGKTALCDQLAGYVAANGGQTLRGHCYEEDSLSLPYLAFVEAIRAYARTRDDEGLRADLRSGAAEVARLVPEVRERVQVEPPEVRDPEDDRWRLWQSVATFFRNAASAQSIVVVLEDLHWAHPGTLDMLLHVARELNDAPILIVGTYRDVDLPRTHPLHSSLAELRRAGNFLPLTLTGLSVGEVQRMNEVILGKQVAPDQADLLYRQTEGNPLFVQEVLRYLQEQGVDALSSGETLPAGIRDVVGNRLRHLSERAHRTLSTASVIGRDFRLDVLRRIVDWPEDELLSLLEEAGERVIIEPYETSGAGGFRFTHALFRETLYSEIFAPRRVQMHRQVGLALEEVYGRRAEEHAPELVEHFVYGREQGDLDRTLRYGELAARRAMSVFDYGEAARHLDQALNALDALESDDGSQRCELLLLLGEALLLVGETERVVREVAPAALSLAQRLGDHPRAYAACKLGLDSTMPVLQRARYWLDMGELYAGDDPVARIRLARARATDFAFQGRGSEAKALLLNALELARSMESSEWEFATLWGLLGITDLPLQDRTRLVNEYHSRSREGVTARNLATALWNMAATQVAHGDRVKAEELLEEMEALARLTGPGQIANEARNVKCLLASLDGRLEEADFSGFGLAWAVWGPAIAGWQGIDYRPPTSGEDRFLDRVLVVHHAALWGRPGAAADMVGAMKQVMPSHFASDAHVAYVALLMEAAALVGDQVLCEQLYLSLQARDLGTPLSNWVTRPLQRAMGDAAAFLGRHEEARGYYEEALAICDKIGHRPERAIARERLAEVLLGHYPEERQAALDHLGIAIAELDAMGMQPELKRAQALLTGFAGSVQSQPSYPDGLSTREVEVLRLVSAGRSNAQIAEELVISLNTVQHHVSRILSKTGSASRTEAAAYARTRNLI